MFGIGIQEILVIIVIALLVIGPDQLPKVARTMGQLMAQFKRATNDLRDAVNRERSEHEELRDLNEFIEGAAHEAQPSGTIRFGALDGGGPVTCAVDARRSRFQYLTVNPETGEAEMRYHLEFATDAGRVALPIDWEAVGWLWSLDGYPSDPAHAQFAGKSLRGMRIWKVGGGAYDPGAAEEAARRLADELGAEWQAVYIETVGHNRLSPEEKDQLGRTLQLVD